MVLDKKWKTSESFLSGHFGHTLPRGPLKLLIWYTVRSFHAHLHYVSALVKSREHFQRIASILQFSTPKIYLILE